MKLLYSPSVVNLLSLLNAFRSSQKGALGKLPLDLTDRELLFENVGSLIGAMLMERVNLLRDLDEKKKTF